MSVYNYMYSVNTKKIYIALYGVRSSLPPNWLYIPLMIPGIYCRGSGLYIVHIPSPPPTVFPEPKNIGKAISYRFLETSALSPLRGFHQKTTALKTKRGVSTWKEWRFEKKFSGKPISRKLFTTIWGARSCVSRLGSILICCRWVLGKHDNHTSPKIPNGG